MSPRDLVAVVDDDESVRNAVQGILRSVGVKARTFASAEAFLDSGEQSGTGCVITDVQMPGMTGIELQARLAADEQRIPIIFITAYGNPRMQALAMQAGALDFLPKPFNDEALLKSVRTALAG
jgi:FixJ family two-component response regulator